MRLLVTGCCRGTRRIHRLAPQSFRFLLSGSVSLMADIITNPGGPASVPEGRIPPSVLSDLYVLRSAAE